jgi:hypothetical protein
MKELWVGNARCSWGTRNSHLCEPSPDNGVDCGRGRAIGKV